MDKLSLGLITEVNAEKSFFKASIDCDNLGRGGFPTVIRFAFSGYSYEKGSGVFYIPVVGDYAVLADVCGSYFPLSFFSPFCHPREGDISQSAEENPYGVKHEKWQTLPEDKGDLNWSAGRRKLLPGSGALLGAKGNNGVIVYPSNRVDVFASEMVYRLYFADPTEGENFSSIIDRTIEYFLETTSYYKSCERVRESNGEIGTESNSGESFNVLTKEDFFIKGGYDSDPKKRTVGKTKEDFFQIQTGKFLDQKNLEVVRVEAVRYPDEEYGVESINSESSEGAQRKMEDIDGVTPVDLTVDSKGRQNKSKVAVVYLRDGSRILTSEENIEFQSRNSFGVFVPDEGSKEFGIFMGTDKSARFYGKKKVILKSEEKCDIISGGDVLFQSEELEVTMEEDKFSIKKKSSGSTSIDNVTGAQ